MWSNCVQFMKTIFLSTWGFCLPAHSHKPLNDCQSPWGDPTFWFPCLSSINLFSKSGTSKWMCVSMCTCECVFKRGHECAFECVWEYTHIRSSEVNPEYLSIIICPTLLRQGLLLVWKMSSRLGETTMIHLEFLPSHSGITIAHHHARLLKCVI